MAPRCGSPLSKLQRRSRDDVALTKRPASDSTRGDGLLPQLHYGLRHCGEIFVDRRDDLRTVTDRGRDAFDRAGAHVAYRKHAAAAGLHGKSVVGEILAGEDEPAVVELEPRRGKPIRVRLGTDE